MANSENGKIIPVLSPEDFMRGWFTIPNGKGLSEEAVKQAVVTAGLDPDVIGTADETSVFVLGKAKNFVQGIVSPTDVNPSKS